MTRSVIIFLHGQTDVWGAGAGAASARIQLSAMRIGQEPWKAQRLPRLLSIHTRMNQLGFLGWVGCDMMGVIELFFVTPLCERLFVFDGLQN